MPEICTYCTVQYVQYIYGNVMNGRGASSSLSDYKNVNVNGFNFSRDKIRVLLLCNIENCSVHCLQLAMAHL